VLALAALTSLVAVPPAVAGTGGTGAVVSEAEWILSARGGPRVNAAPDPGAVAHEYTRRGWAVLPLFAPIGGRCRCGRPDCIRPGKHPILRHGLLEARTDPARWLAPGGPAGRGPTLA